MKLLLNFASALALILALATNSSAQVTWVGAGDGTSWNDAANWQPAMVPPADSVVLINSDVTITGTATIAPKRITISGASSVTLNLNLHIGDGIKDDHAVVINARSTLTLASGRTFHLHPKDNKQAVVAFASADSSTLNIAQGASVMVMSGTNGINLAAPRSWVNIAGTVTFSSAVKTCMRSNGTTVVSSTGSLVGNNNTTDGLAVLAGTFTNHGSIQITSPNDDCLDINNGASFVNSGNLILSAKDSAGTANNAISIGLDTVAGFFTNSATGVILAHAGFKDVGRAINVGGMGRLTNEGSITLTGLPLTTSRLYSRGEVTNAFNAILDLGDSRGNINLGTFLNDGLIKSTRDGSGLFCTDMSTLVNNGFFAYNNGTAFAAGMGAVINNGIGINNPNQAVISAMNTCQADIAQQPYAWYEGANLVAMANDTGLLVLPAMSVSADSVTLTTTIPGVAIQLKRICPSAYAVSVFDPAPQVMELGINPSLVRNHHSVQVTVPTAYEGTDIKFELFSQTGQIVRTINSAAAFERTLSMDGIPAGFYLLRGQVPNGILIGRLMVVQD
jgi:hypothetical protein